MIDQLDLNEFLEVDNIFPEYDDYVPPKRRGPKPKLIRNPLDDIPNYTYVNREGRPRVWLDDCLTGAIRAYGTEKDKRLQDPTKYVSFNKVFKVLLNLRGEISSSRVIDALGVCRDTAWRIMSVIEFATFSIKRELAKPSRILEYRPTTTTYRKRI